MRGDETLYLRIQNELGPDLGMTAPGASVDPGHGYRGPEGALFDTRQGDDRYGEGTAVASRPRSSPTGRRAST